MSEEEEQKEKEAAEKAEAEAKTKADADDAKKAGAETKDKEVIDDAVKAAAETKKENDKKEELIERAEKLMDRKEALAKLGGGSLAGQAEKKESDDEKWEKDAKERYKGTGLDPTPDDTPTEFT